VLKKRNSALEMKRLVNFFYEGVVMSSPMVVVPRVFVLVLVGLVTGLSGCGGDSASSAPDAGPVGQSGLLSGCTVSEDTNMTDCPIPEGWTVVDEESFAEGRLNGAGNPTLYAANLTGVPGGISTSGAHTGSYGLACMTTGEQSFCNYNVPTGAAKEVYMSYWQYLGENAVATLDFYLAKLQNSRMRDIRFDPNPPPGPYLTLTTQYQVYSEGDGKRSIACYSGSGCTTEGQGSVSGELYWNISPGSWEQWEVWVKHSTCDGGTPVPDGFFRAYLNGRLVMSIEEMNTTLCPSLADDPTITAQVGGYQSVQAALNEDNQCVPYGSFEYHHAMSCRPQFTDCPEHMADGVTPCWGNQQPYERHLDDIIIMKR
jgi:hypothetical protein